MDEPVVPAHDRALERLRIQRRQLAPLRTVVVAVAILITLSNKPFAGHTGKGFGIVGCLVLFCVALLLWPFAGADARPLGSSNISLLRWIDLTILAGSSIALAALQPNGAAELPASVTVFIAGVVFSSEIALGVGFVIVVGLGIALNGTLGVGALVASVLLCAVLGITGGLLRKARLSQEHTEELLIELEKARDDQAHAAAMAERTAIARELHDVLAHSLSGLSIQLEGARQLARKEDVNDDLLRTIDAAAELAKVGLVEARTAVGALRVEPALGLAQLPALFEHFRENFAIRISFNESGIERAISPATNLAIYRVTSEALTNVARHAPGAFTSIALTWHDAGVELLVSNAGSGELSTSASGGFGVTGMRERVERLGGSFSAGPSNSAWTVRAVLPA